MARIVVVEDDRSFRKHVRNMFGTSHEIVDCPSPAALAAIAEPETLTHAFVDLSYGSFNHLTSTRRPNGLDAIVMLDELAPACTPLAMSVLSEGPFFELARAVYQFWPETPILSKLDVDHFNRSAALFLAGEPTPWHEDGLRATYDVMTMPDWRNRIPDLMVGGGVGNAYRLVEEIARFPEQPANADIAQRLGAKAKSGVSVRLSDFRTRFKPWLTDPSIQKGAGLWNWIAPRFPVFDAARPNGL